MTVPASSPFMQQWQLPALGHENLQLVQVPIPEPGRGQVLVRVHAASLNYRDLMILRDGMGMVPALPLVPGSDMAGEVVALGPGVAEFTVGDAVISTFFAGWQDGVQPRTSLPLGSPGPGMLSEYVVLGEDNLVAAPLQLDFAQASTLTCAGATAWFALAESAPTRPGDTVVIMGHGRRGAVRHADCPCAGCARGGGFGQRRQAGAGCAAGCRPRHPPPPLSLIHI